MVAVTYLSIGGPPSSPPTALFLRIRRTAIAIAASVQNRVTENAKLKLTKKKIYWIILLNK